LHMVPENFEQLQTNQQQLMKMKEALRHEQMKNYNVNVQIRTPNFEKPAQEQIYLDAYDYTLVATVP